MSDGHTDAFRYSRYYEGLMLKEREKIDKRLSEGVLVLQDSTEIALDHVKLRLDGETMDLMGFLKRMLIAKENKYRGY